MRLISDDLDEIISQYGVTHFTFSQIRDLKIPDHATSKAISDLSGRAGVAKVVSECENVCDVYLDEFENATRDHEDKLEHVRKWMASTWTDREQLRTVCQHVQICRKIVEIALLSS